MLISFEGSDLVIDTQDIMQSRNAVACTCAIFACTPPEQGLDLAAYILGEGAQFRAGDMAEAMGVSETTVRTRIKRARELVEIARREKSGILSLPLREGAAATDP